MQYVINSESAESVFAMAENMPPIAEELFWAIILACPKKGVILELGSGATTELFAKHRTIYSVENDPAYIGKHNDKGRYIYAPLAQNIWYNVERLRNLPAYDVLFVDGPAHDSRMDMFVRHIDLFNPRAHWFFDDTAHAAFEGGFKEVQRIRGKTMIRFTKCYKEYGVIMSD
jgi:hypothetical protein